MKTKIRKMANSQHDISLRVDLSQAQAGFKDISASIDRLNQSIDRLGQMMTQGMTKGATRTRSVKKSTEELNAELKKLEAEYQRIKAQDPFTRGRQQQLGQYRKEINRVRGEMDRVTQSQTKLNHQVSLGRQLFLRLKSVMLTVFGAYAIIQGVRNTISALAKFELGMARVGAITGATAKELDKLTNSAILAASNGIFSPTQIAEVEVVLAKLGFTVTEIGQSINDIANLALATGEDLTTSAELVASTLRGLGLEASQTRHVVDVLGKSFTTSALDVGKYAESIKYLAPIARNMGWELEDLTAILGVLADSMISGSLAGTGTRQMLIQLADASSDANKILGRQVETFDDFLDFLDKLKDSGAGLNEAVNLFNVRSATAVVNLIENSGKLREYRGQLDKTSGAIKEMADRIRSELIPTTQDLSASWQAWLNSTAEIGGLSNTLDGVKGALDAVTLANVHHIRTWNTLGQILVRYREIWLKWFKTGELDFSNLLRNEGFDLLQGQVESLDENITLLTSDLGKFFDNVRVGARDVAGTQEKALYFIREYSTRLSETYNEISKRETELAENLQKQNDLITELRDSDTTETRKAAILNELDVLKIRVIELETLIDFYKGAKKELSDNIFQNMLKVDLDTLKTTLSRLQTTYGSFNMAMKATPIGDFMRGQMLMYQKAINQILNKTEEATEEITDEQINNQRRLLQLREQFELEMASLIDDDEERELKTLEIKHKYKQKYYELDILLARGNRDDLQAIYNLMSSDIKTFLDDEAKIRKKYRDKEFDEALKGGKDWIDLQKTYLDRDLQLMENSGATKEELWRKEMERLIELKEIEVLLAEESGAAALEVQKLNAELEKLEAQLAGGFKGEDGGETEPELNLKKLGQGIKQLASEIIDSLQSVADMEEQITGEILSSLNNRVAEVQRELETETELYVNGYASNVAAKKKEYNEIKAARDQAIKDHEKAMKKQQTLSAISQAIDLASGVANIMSQYSEIPWVGVALGAAAVAAFLGLFQSSKKKAYNYAQYGEGGEIKGRSHAMGGEVIEAEGGEFVVRKEQYSKYGSLIRAINEDNLPKLDANIINNTSFGKQSNVVVSTKEWGEIRDLLKDNLRRESVEFVGGKKIVTKGIRKRITNV